MNMPDCYTVFMFLKLFSVLSKGCKNLHQRIKLASGCVMSIYVLLGVMPHSCIFMYQHFERICCLHLEHSCPKDRGSNFQMLVCFNQTTQTHIPEERSFFSHYCEKLKSQWVNCFFWLYTVCPGLAWGG